MTRIILSASLLLLFIGHGEAPSRQPAEQGARAKVRMWYNRFLDREPDRGSEPMVRALHHGEDPDAIVAAILGSDEYYERAGATPAGFIRHLFLDLIGRAPNATEVRHWGARVRTEPRQDIAADFLSRNPQDWESDERPGDSRRYDYRRPNYPIRRPYR